MNKLWKMLPMPIPRDALSTTVFPALQGKMTAETNAACEGISEMMAARDLPLMAIDDPLAPLARRQDFREKLMPLLQLMDPLDFVYYKEHTEDEVSLNFILSTIRTTTGSQPRESSNK